jgi:O-6-methylguanine DNA methyltransferase
MDDRVVVSSVHSPWGEIWLASTAKGLCGILLRGGREALEVRVRSRTGLSTFHEDPKAHAAATEQIEQYFRGERKQFQLPLDLRGTSFQQQVWKALQQIPYGETRSYGEIAVAVGNLRAVRAVGQANGRNPVPLIVPCHRVIRSNGKLGGFGGGLDLKETLLALEKHYSSGS